MTEFLYPLLTLWRREEADSGGPGRQRGGVSASLAVTLHGSSNPAGLVFASAGKAKAQNAGLAGGYPGNTGIENLVRGVDVNAALREGRIPQSIEDFGGEAELGACYAQSYLAPGEVLHMHWQGGGGYGDPLHRDPEAVRHEVSELKVTAAARDVYGVALDGESVDADGTERLRADLVAERAARSAGPATPYGRIDLGGAARVDDNRVRVDSAVACGHCGQQRAELGTDAELQLSRFDGPSSAAGPSVLSGPGRYVDDEIVFRQLACPGCHAAIYSGIVPKDHVDHVLDTERFLPTH